MRRDESGSRGHGRQGPHVPRTKQPVDRPIHSQPRRVRARHSTFRAMIRVGAGGRESRNIGVPVSTNGIVRPAPELPTAAPAGSRRPSGASMDNSYCLAPAHARIAFPSVKGIEGGAACGVWGQPLIVDIVRLDESGKLRHERQRPVCISDTATRLPVPPLTGDSKTAGQSGLHRGQRHTQSSQSCPGALPSVPVIVGIILCPLCWASFHRGRCGDRVFT